MGPMRTDGTRVVLDYFSTETSVRKLEEWRGETGDGTDLSSPPSTLTLFSNLVHQLSIMVEGR